MGSLLEENKPKWDDDILNDMFIERDRKLIRNIPLVVEIMRTYSYGQRRATDPLPSKAATEVSLVKEIPV